MEVQATTNQTIINGSMDNEKSKNVAVIVAHPMMKHYGAGGTILNHTGWKWCVVCLCRGVTPIVFQVLQGIKSIGGWGVIGDLDDGLNKFPWLKKRLSRRYYNSCLQHISIWLFHMIRREYTKHLRHEEIGRATITLWNQGKISGRRALDFCLWRWE